MTPTSSSVTTDEAPADEQLGGAERARRIDEDGTLLGADVARPGTDVAVRRCDAPATLPEMMRLASELAHANILPGHLRRQPANVLALMFAARSLDIPIWTAFQALNVIDGRIGMDATFMRALVLRAGHRFRIVERTDERAAVEITRHDDPEPRLTEFTWADAVDAGLVRKEVWQRYPKAMLIARATTAAVRDHTPEVLFASAYTPEELDVVVDDTGNALTVIPSERVHDDDNPAMGTDVVRRDASAAAALRADYERRIDAAASADDLNAIWRDAKAGGVLGAPLRDGAEPETVEQALWSRSAELRALADARAVLVDAGLDPHVVDADIVDDAADERSAERDDDAEELWLRPGDNDGYGA